MGATMPRLHSEVVLSRYFGNNVNVVAKMCQRCYEECEDVTITSVNFIFLKQTNELKDLIDVLKMLTDKNITEEECGFSESDKEFSSRYTKAFNDAINIVIADTHEDDYRFKGFSSADFDMSIKEKKNIVRACDRIRFKLYKRVSMRSLRRNAFKGRISKSKRSLSDNESKYFSIVFDNNNVDTVTIKEEYPKADIKVDHCKGHTWNGLCLSSVKSEYDDYESKYFSFTKKEGIKYEILGHKQPMFVPPKSPHNLIEEYLYHDPWALLVATIFLNRTSCMCARPYVFWFLNENPSPLEVLGKYPRELEKYFVKLGLQKTRALQVWRMSHDFVYKPWKNVKDLYGIGIYGENAFRMFCLGDFSVEPKDRFLKIYKAWYEKIALKETIVVNKGA